MAKPTQSNRERALWRTKCRERLSEHIYDRLGISVPPPDVRLIPGPQDPYKWSVLPEKKRLFNKHLSKHCIQAYKEIYAGIGQSFEALPADATSSIEEKELTQGLCDNEIATRPAISFMARINELSTLNAALEAELEQWKLIASQAQGLNHDLEASLEATHLNINSLQLENQRISENCLELGSDVESYRAKASLAQEVIKELFSCYQSARAKISSPNLKARNKILS